jgi:hypothetical protein
LKKIPFSPELARFLLGGVKFTTYIEGRCRSRNENMGGMGHGFLLLFLPAVTSLFTYNSIPIIISHFGQKNHFSSKKMKKHQFFFENFFWGKNFPPICDYFIRFITI